MTIGQRLKLLRGTTSQANIAEILKIPQTTWSNYENNKNKPDFALIDTLCSTFSVNTDWLLFGRGPMRPGEAAPVAPDSTPLPQPTPETPVAAQESVYARGTTREAELETERRERRELTAEVLLMTAENRELTAEVRHLWKENSELREKCARLEERQYQRSISHDGGEAVG